MRKTIKILLLVIVVICILTAIVLFSKGMGGGGDSSIATTSFEKLIQTKTDSLVKGKEYVKAHQGFLSILGDINTEASIFLADGTKNLSDEEVLHSKQLLFYEYAPIFTEYGLSYFNHSSWDDSVIKALRSEASTLQSMKVAETGVKISVDLAKIITTVDEYYAAWQLVNSASHCSSVGAIATLKSNASKYQHKPLTNNASLSAALSSVESTAKSAVVRNIVGHCQNVVNRYRSYGDYATWMSVYEKACGLIAEYQNKYGSTSELQRARGQLSNADTDALSYYSSLQ